MPQPLTRLRLLARAVLRLSLPLVLLLLLGASSARADEEGVDTPGGTKNDDVRLGRCRCHEGKATWSYLRSPLSEPEDPPRCGLRLAGGSCATRPRPPGTKAACWGRGDEASFWKRHAWSWDIACSACWAGEGDNPCDALLGGPDPEKGRVLKERLEAEAPCALGNIVVAISPHFYVVTNLHDKVKVRTRRGGLRLMSAHEVAHLFAQRCELAYDDFETWFGGPIVLPKPMAVYIVNRKHELASVSDRYFGGNEIHMNYAFNYGDRIAQGFSGNGFVVSLEEQNTDPKLHGFVRHQIGHILFSCWIETNGFEDHCPRWAWIGAAHFLMKLLPPQKDYATYCFGESAGGAGSGKRWPKRVRDMARRAMPPIETFFNKNSLSDFGYKDHLRAWSMMDLGLREDRSRWLSLLRVLRGGGDEGVAFKEALGITPEQYHERWVERVTGKRRRLGPEPKEDGGDPDDPTRREREAIRSTLDPEVLAGRLRGLDEIRDVKVAAVVLERLIGAGDLVRETVHLLLRKTTSPEILAYLRRDGLYHPEGAVRAAVVRALGALRDERSRPILETLLDDSYWLVRANAAEALHRMGAGPSRDELLRALGEKDHKAWLLIADALASTGVPSKEATEKILERVEDKRWQVRLVAYQALSRIGTEEAIAPLIERYGMEHGRLYKDVHAALAALTHDDLGENPESWRRWWKDQKETYGGLGPRPEKDATQTSAGRYANQGDGKTVDRPSKNDYYGKEFFSRSVGFVLDVSDSMKINMEIVPEQAKRLGNIPIQGRRMDIAQQALLGSLRRLDPRTRFRLVFFQSTVKVWNDRMVAANAPNQAAAQSAVERLQPRGETNFHGAIRAALGLHEKTLDEAKLEDAPDTVFFLTDGRPTKGEITAMPELVSWLQRVNRFARVDLHVIALGDLNVDAEQLALLAQAGGGTLIHVREVGYGNVGYPGDGGDALREAELR